MRKLQSSIRTGMLWLSSLSVVSTAGAAGPIPVTVCGQVVEGRGVLAADLFCSNPNLNAGVVLGVGGSLDLAGHTLTVEEHGTTAIKCGYSCKVFGGSIVLIGEAGWAVHAAERVNVSDVEISVVANALNARYAHGVTGRIGKISSSVITSVYDCAAGFEKVQVRDVQCVDNIVQGVEGSKRVLVKDSTFEGFPNGAFRGVWSSTVTGRVTVKGSVIGGYEHSIATWHARPPAVRETQCERSGVLENEGVTGTWNVCSLD
jgi:hypothetical protein